MLVVGAWVLRRRVRRFLRRVAAGLQLSVAQVELAEATTLRR